MKRALVVTHGFFGDIIFSTTLAKTLKLRYDYRYVDYLIGFPQVLELIQCNEWIDEIYWNEGEYSSFVRYDHYALESTHDIFQIDRMDFSEIPQKQMHRQCGLLDRGPLDFTYSVCVDHGLAEQYRTQWWSEGVRKPVVAWGNDMYDRAFEFTEEEYDRAIDVPYKGYGGRLRDIDYMIKELGRWFHMVEVGAKHTKQSDPIPRHDDKSLLETASIILAADAYFGIEGGLINIAAGAGTSTVMLSEYVHQLYGPKGVMWQLEDPQLGPSKYFGDRRHKDLPLYKTSDELVDLTRGYIYNFLR